MKPPCNLPCILLLALSALTFNLSAQEIYRMTVAVGSTEDKISIQEEVRKCKSFPVNRAQEGNN